MVHEDMLDPTLDAIGRVVVAAGHLDIALAFLRHALVPGDGPVLIDMTTQMCKNIRSMLPTVGAVALRSEIESAIADIDRVGGLNDQRNDVVHGWWASDHKEVGYSRSRAKQGESQWTTVEPTVEELRALATTVLLHHALLHQLAYRVR
jgi:hypothetical protein